ncbi:MAG: calcineurin-like phosphoesterase family protein [Prevotella sp.]|nr:calcineurin-like phosphoesterase family protein [Prevotella sp.]
MKHTIIFTSLLCLESIVTLAQRPGNILISGTVMDTEGKPVANVVVNDGVHFTQTDIQGKWTFVTDTCLSKFVSISTPAAYELPSENGLARFYKPIQDIRKGKDNRFVLKKRKGESDRFSYIAISDPQVLNEKDMYRWNEETVKDIRTTVDSLRKTREVVGMTLGDLVFDNMGLYTKYASSMQNLKMTVFQTIGNHDFDKRFQDLHNMRYGAPQYAEHYYNRFFGPTDYSFNIGNIHVITMKSINYVGHRQYIEALTDAQLEWLKKDLSYVPKGSAVFVNMHAAGWNRIMNTDNIRNAGSLEQVLQGYNVHFFCGHTHFYQNVQVSPSLYQHNIGAACGAWWAGGVSQCGAPNGYLVVDVDGEKVSWHFKPTGRDISCQMRLYKPHEFRRAAKYVVANVWDYDEQCKVEWYADGRKMGNMEQFTDVDEMYIRQQNAINKDEEEILTNHLFRCLPGKAKTVKVVFSNRFGQQYAETVTID